MTSCLYYSLKEKASGRSSERSLTRHEMLCPRPPSLFLEKIFWLVLIMGESRDSGQDPGFDEKGK